MTESELKALKVGDLVIVSDVSGWSRWNEEQRKIFVGRVAKLTKTHINPERFSISFLETKGLPMETREAIDFTIGIHSMKTSFKPYSYTSERETTVESKYRY